MQQMPCHRTIPSLQYAQRSIGSVPMVRRSVNQKYHYNTLCCRAKNIMIAWWIFPIKERKHGAKTTFLYAKKAVITTALFDCSGSYLLSRAVSHQVSSAWQSLTTVFGMGTGVTSVLSPPDKLTMHSYSTSYWSFLLWPALGQALGLLVLLSSIHYCTSTCNLSNT